MTYVSSAYVLGLDALSYVFLAVLVVRIRLPESGQVQAKAPPQQLAAMLAARSAALITASPLGTALGGPLTTTLGPRATLGGSGLATVALGALACVLLLARRGRPPTHMDTS